MENRYHMQNKSKNIMVESPYTDEGKKRLQHFRELNPNDWKNCRIKDVIQALPSSINYYQVYKIHTDY